MWYINLQNFFSVLQYSIIFSSVENYHKMLFKPFMEMIDIGCPQNWYPYHWQTLNKLQMDFFYDYRRRIKEVRLHQEIKVPK